MTDYSEPVKALRCNALSKQCDSCKYGYHLCPDSECNDACNVEQVYADAAAAIEDLQAQLPKRGEWKTTDAFPHRVYCSKCFRTYVPNDRWQIWVDNELPRNYCPNCGAKMEVQDA